ILEADLDGDGEFESTRVKGTYPDQSTENITARTAANKDIIIDGDALKMRRRVEVLKSNSSAKYITSITISNADATSEAVIKTKTKSNQSNDRVAAGDVNGDGVNTAINNSHSNIKNLKAVAKFSDGSTMDITESF